MEKYSAIGKVLVFIFAIFATTSCAGKAASEPGSPQEVLAAVTKAKVRDYWTNDYGREKRSGGYSVIVPVGRAAKLLDSVRRQVPPGYVAFVGTTNNLETFTANRAEIVVAPGQDQFDILRLAATDGVNHDKTTDQIIEKLKGWDSEFGIDIWQAETDTVQLKLKSMPVDLGKLSEEIVAFCPDIVEQGDGGVEALRDAIEKEGTVFLWWD